MESMLASVTDTLEVSALKALAEMRASTEAAERMHWLAERANEGLLTEEREFQTDHGLSQAKLAADLHISPQFG